MTEAKRKIAKTTKKSVRKLPPAKTPEAREKQMVLLAHDLAEKQLREGTASSQIITHFLKLGSSKEKLEKDILEQQKKLMIAKTEAIESHQKIQELYTEALTAMRRYSGYDLKDVEEDIEEYDDGRP